MDKNNIDEKQNILKTNHLLNKINEIKSKIKMK